MGTQTPSLRRRPIQDRGQRTFELLLDTTAALLQEAGLAALSTNAVAARAGVTAPTLYRYFPNKEAMMVALGERYVEVELRWTSGLERIGDPSHALENLVREIVEGYAKAADEHPAISVLRAAMRTMPELAALEERSLADTSKRLHRALKRRFPSMPAAEGRTAARLVVETLCTGIDRSRGLPPAERKRHRRHLQHMVAGHLATLGEDHEKRIPKPTKRRTGSRSS